MLTFISSVFLGLPFTFAIFISFGGMVHSFIHFFVYFRTGGRDWGRFAHLQNLSQPSAFTHGFFWCDRSDYRWRSDRWPVVPLGLSSFYVSFRWSSCFFSQKQVWEISCIFGLWLFQVGILFFPTGTFLTFSFWVELHSFQTDSISMQCIPDFLYLCMQWVIDWLACTFHLLSLLMIFAVWLCSLNRLIWDRHGSKLSSLFLVTCCFFFLMNSLEIFTASPKSSFLTRTGVPETGFPSLYFLCAFSWV